MRSSLTTPFSTSAAMLCFFSAIALQGHALAQSRESLAQAMIEPHVGDVLPLGLVFHDHNGYPVQLAEMTGKRPTVICLVYFECPMLCKLAADGLVRGAASIHENAGEQYNIAFISFDPRDTPQRALAARTLVLSQYNRGAHGNGWYVLTGDEAAIHKFTEAVGFRYVWDEQTQQFAHASGLVLIAKSGAITEYLDGVHFAPKELSDAIARADAEELRPREATTFVRCYLYDLTTGRFGAIVHWTLRIFCVIAVLAISLLVARLIWQFLGTL